jgi:methyl-accepting chemotaxis protein
MELTIRNKLFMICGGGALLVLLSAGLGFLMLWNSIQIYENKVVALHADVEAILRIQSTFKKQVQEWKDVLLRGSDPAAFDKYWAGFKKMERDVQEQTAGLSSRISDSNVKQQLEKFSRAHMEMGGKYSKGLDIFKDSGFDSKAGDVAVKGMDRAPTEILSEAASLMQTLADDASKEAAVQSRKAVVYSLSAIAVTIVVAFILFQWMIRQSILNPAQQLMQDLGRLAEGDFSVSVKNSSKDEIGNVAESAEKLRGALGGILGEVNSSSNTLSAASTQLAANSQQVSATSSLQSEATSSVAAAIEEMTVSISSVSDSVDQGRLRVAKALEDTTSGNQKLSDLVGKIDSVELAMQKISTSVDEFLESTKSIATMTRRVREIADQTNLLALNAAIEAARAGEQGRGFAVVADEVRKLAENSTRSVAEIDKITQTLNERSNVVAESIQDGQHSLALSQELIKIVESMLSEATQSVIQVSQDMDVISGAAKEQTEASNNIAGNMERIAQMIEEGCVAANQVAGAAGDLEQLATQLHNSTLNFKLS